MERAAFREWRARLWSRVPPHRVLEVGVGTGKNMLNPLVVRLLDANINRRTVENVRLSGLTLVDVEQVRGNLVKLIHARPAQEAT